MSTNEKDDFTPREKAQIDALIKNYELTVKSYEEQQKLLYGVPLVVGAISGIVLKGVDLSGGQFVGYGLIVAFMLTLFWEKILRELNKLKSYRFYLENQINKCFGDEIFIYGIRNNAVEEQELQSRKRSYLISSLVVFPSFLIILFFEKEIPSVMVICGILSCIVLCRLLRNSEKSLEWYNKEINKRSIKYHT